MFILGMKLIPPSVLRFIVDTSKKNLAFYFCVTKIRFIAESIIFRINYINICLAVPRVFPEVFVLHYVYCMIPVKKEVQDDHLLYFFTQ